MHLNELKQKPITDLITMAEELGVEDPRGLRKHELVFGILQARSEADGIIYGEGVSREGDLLDLAAASNLVEKSGSWFSFKGERIGQGRDNAKAFLKEHPDTAAAIDRELRKQLGLLPASAEAVAAGRK